MHKLLLGCATLLIASTTLSADTLYINTEEYAPLSYTENGEIKGVATDQVKLILERAGINYSMNVYPWARAYKMAQTDRDTCVFTTSNTPERTHLFKWVEPLSLNKSILIKVAGKALDITSLEEAKPYTIGVQNEDVGGEFLKNNGFKNLEFATHVDRSVLKLKAGRVDMVALAESRFKELSANDDSLEKVIEILALKMGLACNPSVKGKIIEKLQAQLDALIEDGTQQKIIEEYESIYAR